MGRQSQADETAATELDLYAENESALYGQYKAIVANLLRKMRAGKYDAAKAPRLWLYWYDAAAKRYARESGDVAWSVMFTKATRMAAARDRAHREYERMKSGEHDYLLRGSR